MKNLILVLLLATPAFAQELVHATALGSAKFSDLAALELPQREPRTRKHRFLPAFAARVAPAVHANAVLASETIPAPPVRHTFTSGTSRQLAPADASGAVGRTHVVGVYNNAIVIHDRAGNVLGSMSLRQFFATSGAIGDQYDPRTAYDSLHDRWIVMAVDREESLIFAVSESGNPLDSWRRYSIDATGGNIYDFSRIALTRDSVILGTCSGYDYNDSTEFFSIAKSALYGGANPMPVARYTFSGDPFVAPVHGESAATEWVVTADGAGIMIGRLGETVLRWIAAPWHIPQPDLFLSQLGAGDLAYSERQVESAVYRNGSIYAVISAGRIGMTGSSTIVWVRFDPNTLAATWGVIGDPANVVVYAYPSIAANEGGAFLVGFGTFSPAQYPSAAYVYGDLFGRTSAPVTIRAGETPVSVTDRWGDYTTTVSDPIAPANFWTLQIASTNGTWGTLWTHVEAPASRRRAVRH
ncbi:MAG TPA: hypothetical protein VEK11_05730 [Thermoanaerobaculia bacterium]|nr:hypothetical protein [Thermoanaerobaculia bacterium]